PGRERRPPPSGSGPRAASCPHPGAAAAWPAPRSGGRGAAGASRPRPQRRGRRAAGRTARRRRRSGAARSPPRPVGEAVRADEDIVTGTGPRRVERAVDAQALELGGEDSDGTVVFGVEIGEPALDATAGDPQETPVAEDAKLAPRRRLGPV